MNRMRGISTAGLAAIVFGFGLTLTGCPENQYDVNTWIDKLDDSHEVERAVTEIEHLGDPKAIPALGKAWEEQGCPQRILQVMIDLSRPLTGPEADKANLVDFAKNGRPASWDKTLPFLQEAVKKIDPDAPNPAKCGLDESSPRSIENAGKAADALGEAQTDAALQTLIDALAQKYSRPTTKGQASPQAARLEVILALGKYHGDQGGRAVTALSGLLHNDPVSEPVGIVTAAVDALQQIGRPEAQGVLIETMYRVPLQPVFDKVRLALVAGGPGVVDRMRKILLNQDDAVKKLFDDNKLDQYCGDRDPSTGQIAKPLPKCLPTSIRQFYAAVVLGDLYDPSAVPDLLKALKDPALPVAYQGGNPTPNTQDNAIYDALRKIGAPDGAEQLKAVWADPKADTGMRALAVDSYPFMARAGSETDALGKIASDNTGAVDVGLRLEAATTWARLGTGEKEINGLLALADFYAKQANDWRTKADAKLPAYKAADDKLKAARDHLKRAKDEFQKEGGIKTAKADTINDMTNAQKEVDAADEPYDDARADWKPLDDNSKENRSAQRTFETHVARIEIYIHCHGQADEAGCYMKALDAKPDEVAARVGRYVKSVNNKTGDDVWTEDDKKGLVAAEIERAMMELGKMGGKASGSTAALLDHVKSEERLVRQSIMLALPKVAPKPCPDCETKLDAAIKAGSGNSALAELTKETQVLRLYFSWAGKGH